MNKNKILIIALLALVLMMIAPVSAETLTGLIGGDDDIATWNVYYNSTSASGSAGNASVLKAYSIENLGMLSSLIRFDNGQKPGYAAGALPGNTSPFTAWIGSTQIGSGTFGYQRLWIEETETNGYQYWVFNEWNITGQSGNIQINLTIPNYASIGITSFPVYYGGATGFPPGYMGLYSSPTGQIIYGDYLITKNNKIINEYTVTKPSGLMITGTVIKSHEGITYGSRIYVVDGTSDLPVASESTITTNAFNFNVYSETIKLCALDSGSVWHNTSVLFSPGTGTPTPTPTPTQPIGPDNPITPGYIRTMAQCVDGQTSGSIHDCSLDLYDIENTSWSNGSYLDMGSYYGTWWIDTLPGHTINAYASSTGYTPVSRLNLPASSTYMYELILWPSSIPSAGSGFVNLYVLVHDADSGNAITGAAIQVRILDGTTYAQTTGTSGSRMFAVPNSSYTSITVSKYGYVTGTRGITTSASGDDTVRIELLKKVVTAVPTSTIPPGGVTTAVTMDPRSASEKDRDMMDQIRTSGPILIDLAIVATILGLLGLMMKAVK